MKLISVYVVSVLCCCVMDIDGFTSSACLSCVCAHDDRFGGTLVNCSNRALDYIPSRLPGDTTTLLLESNALNELPQQAFIKLKMLVHLNLARNRLKSLKDSAFSGLFRLKELNLESNHLTMNNDTFTNKVFKPLSRLIILKLNNNSDPRTLPPGASYPDFCFRYLSSLKELYIDGLPKPFGRGFLNLRNLKKLTLSGSNGYCTLPVLENSTFVNVPNVEMLNISNCLTYDTEPMTFSVLRNIHVIDISYNSDLGFYNFSKSVYGLQASPLKVLKMNQIYPPYGACTRLDKKHLAYLKNTSLQQLHVDENGITEIEQGAFRMLPATLKILSARENRFSYGIYLFEFANMESLRFVDISFLNKWHTSLNKRDVTSNRIHPHLPILLPRNLETLVFSKSYIRGRIYSMVKREISLKKLIADHNLFSEILGPLYGFEKLEHIDLSHNILSNIDLGTFRNYSAIFMDLSFNDLGTCFSKDKHGEVFSGLSHLQHLNISSNRIKYLPRRMFKELGQLHTLIIAHNELDSFDVDLAHVSHLNYLDLGYNNLQFLSPSVQKDLDELNVTVRLQGNTLTCDCNSLGFLRWMETKGSSIKDVHTTQCIMAGGKHVYLTNLDTLISDLEDQCRPYVVFFLTSTSLFILIMISACICLGYRYRWKLRRLYYLGKNKRHPVANDEPDTYKYDAFVSYADADRGFVKNSMIAELEEKAGLRLCIHHRDFIPGTVIASNIANAIQNSRKTLILLSPSFLKSDWCQFEYNMARAEGVSRRENVIVAVLYRPVQIKDIPRDMAVLFAQYSYLEYSINGYDNEIFWRNITDAVRTPAVDEE